MGKTLVLQRVLLLGLTFVASAGLIVSLLSKSQANIYPAITFFTGSPPQDVLIPQAYISGAVAAPGVYRITPETRVGSLISMAGGVTGDVDPNFIARELNLAKLVADEEHVFIPALITSVEAIPPQPSSSGLLNLNSATAAQLETLPGIGPALAEQIISHRPYASVSDLQDVPGIGESKYAKLQDLVSI